MTNIAIKGLTLPIDFRKSVLEKVFALVKNAESGLLLGPAGMGKTLLFDQIENPAVQKHYLPKINLHCLRLDLLENSSPQLSEFGLEKTLTPNNRILLLVDNTESLDNQRGKELIKSLKSFREKARSQTSLLLASEENILTLPFFSEASSLKSPLLENLIYLDPLNNSDTLSFIKTIAKLQNITLSEGQTAEIAKTSGGFPRLIKRLVKIAASGNLIKIINNPAADLKYSFDVSALSVYLQSHPDLDWTIPLAKPQTPNNSQDTISGISFSKLLTKQEHALAQLLISRREEIVSREDLIKAVWPKNLYETSEHALDQMIHRLKKKLVFSTPSCQLITLRGRGTKLLVKSPNFS